MFAMSRFFRVEHNKSFKMILLLILNQTITVPVRIRVLTRNELQCH
jgi:hypothetical protein